VTQGNRNIKREDAHVVEIKGTGPKERPPMPQGLLRPPGANPTEGTQQSPDQSSEEN